MKLELKCMKWLCELDTFKINDMDAYYEDFGRKDDIDILNAPAYGCGNMKFIPKAPSENILKKYNITTDEYKEICEKLDCLSFGQCGCCI